MMSKALPLFDEESWEQLPAFIAHLPEPIYLIVWGDEQASQREEEAARLCRTLAEHFDGIQFRMLPQRITYDYWPVIGVMRGTPEEYDDVGVRIVGVPAGFQMTSFISAMQAVAFQGSTLDAKTRIQLHTLADKVTMELITAVDDETGPLLAQPVFNMAAANAHVRAHLIMGDMFPQALWKHSVYTLPHLVINGRVHIEGVIDEETILKHIAKAI